LPIAGLVDRVAGDANRDRHLWALALYGLRRGEISGLRWSNVNLANKSVDGVPAWSVRVVENRVALGRQVLTGTPKSKASNRTLPLPDEVVELLRAARKRQLAERLAFGPGYGSTDYVAVDEFGQLPHPDTLTNR
jgi:integrase